MRAGEQFFAGDARLRDAPVRTEVVSREFVEQIGARTLADAVEYTTGVRVENNCQNCNFSQVRLLGLEGPYTQILMDGQPTLSSLAQVYGLEQIPARLIDRVEVTKGGGTALLGPGSVGGVINVVTREPATRGAQFDTTIGSTGGDSLSGPGFSVAISELRAAHEGFFPKLMGAHGALA